MPEPVFVYQVYEYDTYGPGQDLGLFSTWAKAADYLWDYLTVKYDFVNQRKYRADDFYTDGIMDRFRHNVNEDAKEHPFPQGLWIEKREVR